MPNDAKRSSIRRVCSTPRGFNHGLLTTGGKLLFLAGQDASDGEGQIVAPGDMVAQCQQALHNLHAVVA